MTAYTCHAFHFDTRTVPAGATHTWLGGSWTNAGRYAEVVTFRKPCGLVFEARDRGHAEEVVRRWWDDSVPADDRFFGAVIEGGGERWEWPAGESGDRIGQADGGPGRCRSGTKTPPAGHSSQVLPKPARPRWNSPPSSESITSWRPA